MSVEEKLDAIKNGKDIDEETVVILQTTDFSKEKEEKKENSVVTDETPAGEEIKPDVKLEDDVSNKETSAVETPPIATSAEAPAVEIPSVEIPSNPIPTEVPSVEIPSNPATMDPVSSNNMTPSPLSINLDGINNGFTNLSNDLSPSSYDQATKTESDFGTMPNNYYNNENNFNQNAFSSQSGELFSDVYNSLNEDTKTIAAVVTEQDEQFAKDANMKAYERLYDAGPGKQINILRTFSAAAAEWIRSADKSGFVSGEMHDDAKRILRQYEGLSDNEDKFTDDNKNFSFKPKYDGHNSGKYDEASNASNYGYGVNDQYYQNNDNNGISI